MTRNRRSLALLAAGVGLAAVWTFTRPGRAHAHCDTLDGPVAKDGIAALEKKDLNLVLHWVNAAGEVEVRTAFESALSVRKLNPDAKKLADTYFLETLVRVHRASEGAPFTGLKPAGFDLGPAIPAADRAIETGEVDPVLKLVTETTNKAIREKFEAVVAAKKAMKKDDVASGRRYVKAYVEYVHLVEGLYDTSKAHGHEHHEDGAKGAHEHGD